MYVNCATSAGTLEKAGMPALGLCPWVHDCGDPYHSIRIRIRIRMYCAT